MKRKVGISIGMYQRKFGERRALEIAKEIGADAVDFDFCSYHDFKNPESVYSKGKEAVEKHFSALGAYAGVAQQYLFYYERYMGGEK